MNDEKKGLSRRTLLKTGAAATGVSLFNINHVWSQDVTYSGEVFDAGGAVLNISEWGGYWEETQNQLLLNKFQKDFNCQIRYDSTFPWFPKYVAAGPQDPPFAMTNWNMPEMFKTAGAGDYFMEVEEVKANVPNSADLWDFAMQTGVGVTWAFSRYCYVYRTDVEVAPKSFKDFWLPEYAGKRGTYITSNTLQMMFFMASCNAFGSGETDFDAGYEAMRKAMPMKISDFTGNMATLVERGEVNIAVQSDAEALLQKEKGVPVDLYYWDEYKGILTQTKTISKYADPTSKKLAFALLNRTLDPGYQSAFADTFWMRPSNKKAVIPEKMAALGVANTADATSGLHIPDWSAYLVDEIDIVETTNEIFGS
ncbi:type 2 periplasmic-binding domain-containing protein [Roseibium marinum]|uniref:Putative spermidine/putrescine transport system substrate-binding protein n=1 Tax=Roseibium marinum TaxID=281252 RepID=A0A2S3UX99_9HYPH|nr:ABC transporter substrate-binding protein [Roseibium marinum]POF32163.1 putative spermidine/putrescine transport system substrate-binding protein [Roseibium marinum]